MTKAEAESDAKTERAFRYSLRKSSIKREESLFKMVIDFERKTRMAWTQVTGSSCQVCYRNKKYLHEKNNIKDKFLA